LKHATTTSAGRIIARAGQIGANKEGTMRRSAYLPLSCGTTTATVDVDAPPSLLVAVIAIV
jgi:hypothetical protein